MRAKRDFAFERPPHDGRPAWDLNYDAQNDAQDADALTLPWHSDSRSPCGTAPKRLAWSIMIHDEDEAAYDPDHIDPGPKLYYYYHSY